MHWFNLGLCILLIGCQQQENQIDVERSPDNIELFGEGFISTGLYERDMAISHDGNELIYTLGNYKQTIRCLVMIQRTKTGWGEKEVISFSGKYHDIEPFYSPDGNQLFFASTRPMDLNEERSDYNIWVSQRSDLGWADPIALNSNINTENGEYYPSVSANGNLYFTATRDEGMKGLGWKIFISASFSMESTKAHRFWIQISIPKRTNLMLS